MTLAEMRDAIRVAPDTPVSDALLALIVYVGHLERRLTRVERKPAPTASPYDCSAQTNQEAGR